MLAVVALASASCTLQKMPPIVMVRPGPAGTVHRVVQLPNECETEFCKGVDLIVAAELAFRGYEIVELQKLNAVERKRTEVILGSSIEVDGVTATSEQRHVTVQGPTLSDIDIWSLRAELAAMKVDSVVRVRTAEIFAKPRRIATLVTVTRASDATLVTSALCEIEVATYDAFAAGAEQTTRCALEQVLR